jgi:hypothetical protein
LGGGAAASLLLFGLSSLPPLPPKKEVTLLNMVK